MSQAFSHRVLAAHKFKKEFLSESEDQAMRVQQQSVDMREQKQSPPPQPQGDFSTLPKIKARAQPPQTQINTREDRSSSPEFYRNDDTHDKKNNAIWMVNNNQGKWAQKGSPK